MIDSLVMGRWPSGYGATFRRLFTSQNRSSKERGFDPHPPQVLHWFYMFLTLGISEKCVKMVFLRFGGVGTCGVIEFCGGGDGTGM